MPEGVSTPNLPSSSSVIEVIGHKDLGGGLKQTVRIALTDLAELLPASALLKSMIAGTATQVVSSTQTLTVPAWATRAWVRAEGGGGGGGGSNGTGSGGGGGGAGEVREGLLNVSAGASLAITIGAAGAGGDASPTAGGGGGDTIVGAIMTAKGGGGGSAGNATLAFGGSGGSGGSGGFSIPGLQGTRPYLVDSSVVGGAGGGQGAGHGHNRVSSASDNGVTTFAAGCGGGGGANGGTGGNGRAGRVLVAFFP